MGITPRSIVTPPNPFIPIKADNIEDDGINTWEKFYAQDKENDMLKHPVVDYLDMLTLNNPIGIVKLSIGEYVKPKWPKTRTVKE